MFTAWYGRYIPVCQVAAVATRGRSFSRTGRKIKATKAPYRAIHTGPPATGTQTARYQALPPKSAVDD
ncbi:hypothetical protein BHE74_00058580 [Ensete ventricosum]|nr:hypothetical protein BHE74_00058580 [Ensete ventricosum]